MNEPLHKKHPCICGSSLVFNGRINGPGDAAAYYCQKKSCHSYRNEMWLTINEPLPQEGSRIASNLPGETQYGSAPFKGRIFRRGKYSNIRPCDHLFEKFGRSLMVLSVKKYIKTELNKTLTT